MQSALWALWLAGPVILLANALIALWHRWRLFSDPAAVEGTVEEVHPQGGQEPGVAVVSLRVTCAHAGRTGSLWLTRTGREAETIGIGAPIPLVCQQGNPSNVIDARVRPWDDVIGPVVLAVLLLAFMLWLWPFVAGLLFAWGALG